MNPAWGGVRWIALSDDERGGCVLLPACLCVLGCPNDTRGSGAAQLRGPSSASGLPARSLDDAHARFLALWLAPVVLGVLGVGWWCVSAEAVR